MVPRKFYVEADQRFGRLTVLAETGRDAHGHPLAQCRCDCGTVVTVRVHSLAGAQDTRSCGCWQRENGVAQMAQLNATRPPAMSQATRLGKEAARQRAARAANPGPGRAAEAAYRDQLRTDVYDHYGWACACCGSTEDLTIDHVKGDGGAHRKELGLDGSGTKFYRWLRANGFPAGFQTLCRACNRSKAGGTECQLAH
jgi:hypothetical protein